jgi:protein-S-isoprenylcysteine O-methyltransferase Ste14
MTLHERQLTVAILLSLTLFVRVLAQQAAGGVLRDQSDGITREGLPWFTTAMRVGSLICLLAVLAWAFVGTSLPGEVALPPWVGWVGLASAQAGAILLIWVQLALGVHVSGTLHLREDHRLVQHGPYARVRHPMYTAFILLFLGIGLLTHNLLVGTFLLSTQVWTIGWRLAAEERSLLERFGPEWVAYQQHTGVLTPWI